MYCATSEPRTFTTWQIASAATTASELRQSNAFQRTIMCDTRACPSRCVSHGWFGGDLSNSSKRTAMDGNKCGGGEGARRTMRAPLLPALLFVLLLQLQCGEANKTPEPSVSSLAKYVLAFSRPGAFKEIRTVFGDEPAITTACPPGDEGLDCRQEEARRVQDDCPAGDCEACAGCQRPNLWPRCCQRSALCCSQVARACQDCEPAHLRVFCAKHFKRCF